MRHIIGKYCANCDHTYFSRARHDYRPCPCHFDSKGKGERTGGFIDGGRDYIRCGGSGVFVKIPIEQTDEELERDWYYQSNKFGLIKGKVGVEIKDKQ